MANYGLPPPSPFFMEPLLQPLLFKESVSTPAFALTVPKRALTSEIGCMYSQ